VRSAQILTYMKIFPPPPPPPLIQGDPGGGEEVAKASAEVGHICLVFCRSARNDLARPLPVDEPCHAQSGAHRTLGKLLLYQNRLSGQKKTWPGLTRP